MRTTSSCIDFSEISVKKIKNQPLQIKYISQRLNSSKFKLFKDLNFQFNIRNFNHFFKGTPSDFFILRVNAYYTINNFCIIL